MNAELTALVARLDRTDCHHCKDAAAAIRALAGEVERLEGRLAQADEWLVHDPSCAWPHNEDWESKGRVCSCGLAEFLNEVPGEV